MSYVSNDVVDNLVVGEVGVTTVVSYNEDTPHKEAAHIPIQRSAERLLIPIQTSPNWRVCESIYRIKRAYPHCIVED
jgi:hypothetical protein